jgi:hypothetical protein
MRSMSLLQLVGGVAAAGVVAAGTTAFTAGGVTATATAIGGGTAAITVEGAELTAASFTNGTTPGTYDRISGMSLHLAGTNSATLSDSSKVSIAITGTGEQGGATDGAWIDCGTGTGGVWTCATTTPANDYWTGITSVSIKVAAL